MRSDESLFAGRLHVWSLSFLSVLFLSLLAGYALKGFFSRYAADDYCYGYRVNENGFFYNQIHSYLTLTEYSSNRFSLTLFSNIVEIAGGPQFVPFVPTIAIVGWLFSLIYLGIQLNSLNLIEKRRLAMASSALVVLFFTLYLAPNLYQVLFWNPALQPYLTPLVMLTFLAGRFLAAAKSNRFSAWNLLEFGLISFLAAGFSETTTLWQLALFSIGMLLVLYYRKRSGFANRAVVPLATALAFSLIALLLIVVNPTNAIRGLPFNRPDVVTLVVKSFFHAQEFIRLSLLGKPLPFLAVFGFGFILVNIDVGKQKIKELLLFALLFNLAGILMVVATMVPSMYAMFAYPGNRALFPAHFTLVFLLFVNGWLTNIMATRFIRAWPGVWRYSIQLILVIALTGYVVARITPRVYENLDQYQLRAQAWDMRHQAILDEKKAGNQYIIVPAFDSVYGIFEIQDNPEHWVNQCVAKYYGVESISAFQNYNNVPTYPIK